jgi:hypothetical protein
MLNCKSKLLQVKVKWSRYTPWRRLEERRYSSYSLITSSLDGVSGQGHAPAPLYPRGRGHSTHRIRGWVGPAAGLDAEVRGKILFGSSGQTTHWRWTIRLYSKKNPENIYTHRRENLKSRLLKRTAYQLYRKNRRCPTQHWQSYVLRHPSGTYFLPIIVPHQSPYISATSPTHVLSISSKRFPAGVTVGDPIQIGFKNPFLLHSCSHLL